jgi:hypothetical protein
LNIVAIAYAVPNLLIDLVGSSKTSVLHDWFVARQTGENYISDGTY